MALTPYSVSPRRTDHSRGPKPTKYSVSFMPAHLAVAKWPSSCSMTTATRMAMNSSRSPSPASTKRTVTRASTTRRRTTWLKLPDSGVKSCGVSAAAGVPAGGSFAMTVIPPSTLPVRRSSGASGRHASGDRPGFFVGGQDALDLVHRLVAPPVEGLGHHIGDAVPREPAGQERVDGNLIGRAQPRRCRAGADPGLVGQVDAAEHRAVGRLEGQGARLRPVQRAERSGEAVRPSEGVADGEA